MNVNFIDNPKYIAVYFFYMADPKEALDYFSGQVLDSNPSLRLSLGISSASELSEKLALRTARRAIGIAEEVGLTEQADEVNRAVNQGNLIEVIGLSERIHKIVSPDAQESLFGTVFQSVTAGGQEGQQNI